MDAQRTRLYQSLFSTPSTGGTTPTASTAFKLTLGLCTIVTTATTISRISVDVARLGGNRFGIVNALQTHLRLSNYFTLSSFAISSGRYYTLLTSIFNHASVTHFVVNAFALSSYGRQLKSKPFTVLFYGGALLGNIMCLVSEKFSFQSLYYRKRSSRISFRSGEHRPTHQNYPSDTWYLGSSGGIAAIMALWTCLLPDTLVTASFGPLKTTQPFWMHTLSFMIYSFWAQSADLEPTVAHVAHLGGLFWGFGWYVYTFRRWPWSSS